MVFTGIRAVLFDLDGTLIDSEIGITGSMVHALRALDVEPPSRETLRSWIMDSEEFAAKLRRVRPARMRRDRAAPEHSRRP